MDSFKTVVEKLSKDPAVFSRVRSELQSAADPRARFLELSREYGIDVDTSELDRVVAAASRELNEGELESVSGGLNFTNDIHIKGESQILIGLLLPAVQQAQKVRGI